jgi:hypothetical protein
MHDTDDLFPGLSDPRGMGQPGAIPKKVADLTRSAFVADALGLGIAVCASVRWRTVVYLELCLRTKDSWCR